jgi:hypothetical protein
MGVVLSTFGRLAPFDINPSHAGLDVSLLGRLSLTLVRCARATRPDSQRFPGAWVLKKLHNLSPVLRPSTQQHTLNPNLFARQPEL